MSTKCHVRKFRDIQRAHDVLEAVRTKAVHIDLSNFDEDCISAVALALCWVLGHPGGAEFQSQMDEIESLMQDAGVKGQYRV